MLCNSSNPSSWVVPQCSPTSQQSTHNSCLEHSSGLELAPSGWLLCVLPPQRGLPDQTSAMLPGSWVPWTSYACFLHLHSSAVKAALHQSLGRNPVGVPSACHVANARCLWASIHFFLPSNFTFLSHCQRWVGWMLGLVGERGDGVDSGIVSWHRSEAQGQEATG